MYWLLDIAFLALLVLVFSVGLKKGVIGLLLDFGAFFVRFLYTIVVAALFLFVCMITGLVDAFTVPLNKAIGDSVMIPELTGFDSYMIANCLSAVLFFVLGIFIAIFTLWLIVKAITKRNIQRGHKPTFVNKLLGVIVAVVLYIGFTMGLLAFIHSIANVGGLQGLDEALRACPVLSLLYKFNPITPILDKTQIPQLIVNFATGRIRG